MERTHGIYAMRCPLNRTLHKTIQLTSSFELVAPQTPRLDLSTWAPERWPSSSENLLGLYCGRGSLIRGGCQEDPRRSPIDGTRSSNQSSWSSTSGLTDWRIWFGSECRRRWNLPHQVAPCTRRRTMRRRGRNASVTLTGSKGDRAVAILPNTIIL